ncbi:hypothetical protein AMEJIAPC_00256 [Caulobacter sp. NIBR1757]|nr:hypothetical protein AMEJIAPC_00256 [Caulobacter sp. NIBR1757]
MGGAVFGRTTGLLGKVLQYVPVLAFAAMAAVGTHLIQGGAANPTPKNMIWSGAVLATVLVYFMNQRLIRWLYLRKAREVGEAPANECDYQLTDKGLRITWPGYLYEIAWDRISQIALYQNAWLFIASQSYFLPRRLFADNDAERTFLAFALQRLSEEARDRSREAVEVREGMVVAWTGYGKG